MLNLIYGRNLLIGLAILSLPLNASAVTWNFLDNELVGANGVLVDGRAYNVEFVEGSCNTLWNNPGPCQGFTFDTEAQASLASAALLNTVLVDGAPNGVGTVDLDSDPALTRGITGTIASIITMFNEYSSYVILAENKDSNNSDRVAAFGYPSSYSSLDSTNYSSFVYARWTAVPEINGAQLGIGMTLLLSLVLLYREREGLQA